MRRALGALGMIGLVAVSVGGCADEPPKPAGDPRVIPTNCGLPTPQPGFDPGLVPGVFLTEGAEITNAQEERGGFLAAINIPMSVGEAFPLYRSAILADGYEIVTEDNEGFEAEIYVRKGSKLGAVQIRRSACEDASIVFVNVVDQ